MNYKEACKTLTTFLRIVKRICTCIVLFIALYFTALLADQALPNSYLEVFYGFMFAILMICILGSVLAIVSCFLLND